jgi:hypothetical protein
MQDYHSPNAKFQVFLSIYIYCIYMTGWQHGFNFRRTSSKEPQDLNSTLSAQSKLHMHQKLWGNLFTMGPQPNDSTLVYCFSVQVEIAISWPVNFGPSHLLSIFLSAPRAALAHHACDRAASA